MGTLRAQLRQVLRRLARSPMFTAITLLTLAVGIGANTAIFTVVESVLLKPLPYSKPDELVGVWHAAPGINIPELNMSPSDYFIYREQGKVFQDVGIYQRDSVSVTGAGEPEQVRALDVTDGVLPLLGVPPFLGRGFTRGGRRHRQPRRPHALVRVLAAEVRRRTSRSSAAPSRSTASRARSSASCPKRSSSSIRRTARSSFRSSSTAPRCGSACSATRASRASSPA